jgi:hypothetical protein
MARKVKDADLDTRTARESSRSEASRTSAESRKVFTLATVACAVSLGRGLQGITPAMATTHGT